METITDSVFAWPATTSNASATSADLDIAFLQRVCATVPPHERRGVIEWAPNTSDVSWSIVPSRDDRTTFARDADGDDVHQAVVDPLGWPTSRVLLQCGTPRSWRQGETHPLFALSPAAKVLQCLDSRVFGNIASDGPTVREALSIAGRQAVGTVLPLDALAEHGIQSSRGGCDDRSALSLLVRFPSVEEDAGGADSPPPRQVMSHKDYDDDQPELGKHSVATVVVPGFSGAYTVDWTLPRGELASCVTSTRIASIDAPKALLAVLLSKLRSRRSAMAYHLPVWCALADCVTISDMGTVAGLTAARRVWEQRLVDAKRVCSTPATVLGAEQASVLAVGGAAVHWAADRCTRAQAWLDILRTPEAELAVQQWADVIAALRTAFEAEPNRAMTGLCQTKGGVSAGRKRSAVGDWLDTMSLADVAESIAVAVPVHSLTSSPDALTAEADMMQVPVDFPANVAGPRLPGRLVVVLGRCQTFDCQSAADCAAFGRKSDGAVLRAGSGNHHVRGLPPSEFQVPVLHRPTGEAIVARRFGEQWRVVLHAALTTHRATDVVVQPLLSVDDSVWLVGLSAADYSTLVLAHFSSLFDLLERWSEAPDSATDGVATVHVCGAHMHDYAVTAMTSRSRRFACHVVLHAGDPKALALNLVEVAGAEVPQRTVALVCPADTLSIVFGRYGAELHHDRGGCEECCSQRDHADDDYGTSVAESPGATGFSGMSESCGRQALRCEGWRSVLRHWSALADVCATTTLPLMASPWLVESAEETVLQAIHVMDRDDLVADRTRRDERWAPLQPA